MFSEVFKAETVATLGTTVAFNTWCHGLWLVNLKTVHTRSGGAVTSPATKVRYNSPGLAGSWGRPPYGLEWWWPYLHHPWEKRLGCTGRVARRGVKLWPGSKSHLCLE